MKMKIELEEAKQKALQFMKKGYHCGPAVLQVMWEAYDMKDENFLWAAIPFMGGISGENKATCGVLSGAAVALGLRHRHSLADKKQAKEARNKARFHAANLTKAFTEKFGHVTCQQLLGIDFSVPGAYLQFRNSGIAESKCFQYVYFAIEALFQFENKQDADTI